MTEAKPSLQIAALERALESMADRIVELERQRDCALATIEKLRHPTFGQGFAVYATHAMGQPGRQLRGQSFDAAISKGVA